MVETKGNKVTVSYKDVLDDLGFKLISRGSWWQTTAVWRNGNNPTAIKIYKNSGVWMDYVSGGKPRPFESLLFKMGVKKDYNLEKSPIFQESELLTQEKTFPDNCLGRLLPDFEYFKKKEKKHSITERTQKTFQCGLATNGKLYNRIVFPIRNQNGAIHGFSGRDVSGRSTIKWLHSGKANDWFYPYYTIEEVRESVKDRRQIIMVESIGDSMACFQSDYPNTGVAFTNNISPRLTARLAALNVDVVIALNNDLGKPIAQNKGIEGGINSILKLYQVIDFKRLWFMPPKDCADFGEMESLEVTKHFCIDYNESEHKKQMLEVIKLAGRTKVMKTLQPVLRKFKKEWKFYYESDTISV